MQRIIAHLDMDAFYASVEQRDHPEWQGLPVIVGSPPTQRGVVATCSYEARKFGVHSAMASSVAGWLCPDGIFVRPRMDVYRAVSKQVMEILGSLGAPLEQVSIDEAYLDLSALCPAATPDEALQLAVPIAQQLKQRIRAEQQLTCTLGIAANKLLSKIASDLKKPDGLTVITESEKISLLRPMPVRKLYGVGEVTEQTLQRAGLRTIGDIQDYPGDLTHLVGSFAARLKQYAFGQDDRPLELDWEQKSISAEETFLADTSDQPAIMEVLWQQAVEIESELREIKKDALCVSVKVRYGDFTTLTRQTTVQDPVAEAKDIYVAAVQLLQKHKLLGRPLRLIGLEVHNLRPLGVRQLRLL